MHSPAPVDDGVVLVLVDGVVAVHPDGPLPVVAVHVYSCAARALGP